MSILLLLSANVSTIFWISVAIGAAIYKSLEALGPKSPQSLKKGVPGPPGPECQKSVEKAPNDPKRVKKTTQYGKDNIENV